MRRILWSSLVVTLLVVVILSLSACARPQRWRQPQEAQAPAATATLAGQMAQEITTGGEQEYTSVAEEIDKLFQELEKELNQTDTLADLQ